MKPNAVWHYCDWPGRTHLAVRHARWCRRHGATQAKLNWNVAINQIFGSEQMLGCLRETLRKPNILEGTISDEDHGAWRAVFRALWLEAKL